LSSHSEKSDTAGLGGRGGPYRVDRGHKVHQVSDEAKAQVSKETAEAAKQMAEAALKERLQEIGISETEWKMYDGLVQPIRADIVNLKGLLKAVESKKTERAWIKRQSYGEIDDAKLVVSIESFYIDVNILLEISYSKTIITSC
jgi:hypothetical protein